MMNEMAHTCTKPCTKQILDQQCRDYPHVSSHQPFMFYLQL